MRGTYLARIASVPADRFGPETRRSSTTASSSSAADSAVCRPAATSAKLPVDVTLIDRRNHHLFQPLLYQVATGILSPGQIAPPLRHVLRKHKNVKVELAEVDRLRPRPQGRDRPSGWPARPMEIPYDSLIVAAGANQSYFGHDEFALFAPGMKTIDDALELRRRIFGAFEMAEIATDAQEQTRVADRSSSSARARPASRSRARSASSRLRALRGDFRTFDPAVDARDHRRRRRRAAGDVRAQPVAARRRASWTISASSCGWARASPASTRLGVDVTLEDGTTERIAARTVIWAAGVQASPLAGEARGGVRAPRSTGPGASRCCPTSRCPAIPRCSRSAT